MSSRIVDEPPPGAPDWIVTFSDMISLLVTFFILLMTFSSLDLYDSFQVPGDLGGTRGILTARYDNAAAEPPAEDLMAAMHAARGAATPHARPPDGLPDTIAEMGQRLTDEHLELDLEQVPDGLLLRFGTDTSFAPGTAEPPPALSRALGELGRTFQHYPHLLVVEGHTDGAFEPSLAHSSAQDLALARAQAAVEAILAGSEMPAVLLQVAAFGSERPIAADDTPRGREANRRVEVRVLSLSRAQLQDLTGGR